jgi:hypothetical protein
MHLLPILNDLPGQKLIFRSFVYAQDVPYHSTNIEKQCDIRDQHSLFYRSITITNRTNTKNIFRIPEEDPRLKKYNFYEM